MLFPRTVSNKKVRNAVSDSISMLIIAIEITVKLPLSQPAWTTIVPRRTEENRTEIICTQR